MDYQLTDEKRSAIEKIKSLEVRNDDIFLFGYPKSGTTWAQEMIWLIVNDLDYEGAKVFIDERFPVLDSVLFGGDPLRHKLELQCYSDVIGYLKSMKPPRCIKSHFAVKYLPEEIVNGNKKPKIIYIARNPKDVCVSSYYYGTNVLKVVNCSFEEFTEKFLSNFYWPSENYWNHLFYFWNRRFEENILFIKYEDMKKNLLGVVREVSQFFDRILTKEEEDKLVNWLNFNTMKNNAAVNHNSLYGRDGFIRSGQVGDHKEKMSTEILSKYDDWIKKNIQNTDYQP